MRKSALTVCILALCSMTAFGQVSVPNTFASGGSISAAEMNANFKALVDAINAKATAFPLGTVIATFTAPDANGNYMAGSTEWAFADGSVPTDVSISYSGQFPDMRGQFVRGVNANRADGNQDPDFASRSGGDLNKAGSFEGDALQGHRHGFADSMQGVIAWGPGSVIYANSTPSNTLVLDPISDGTHGTPRLSSETRPSNIAVYWYIKVR